MPGRWQVLGGSAARAYIIWTTGRKTNIGRHGHLIFRHFSYAGQADSGVAIVRAARADLLQGKSLTRDSLGEHLRVEVRTGVWEADSDLVLVWDLRLFRLAASS